MFEAVAGTLLFLVFCLVVYLKTGKLPDWEWERRRLRERDWRRMKDD